MPRPCKNRWVSGQPRSVVYKPAGIPARTLEWIAIRLDEFEAIRLLDYLGHDQEKAAELMGVSRPTVTRIYASARQKIAHALTEGKAIAIEGGPVEAFHTPPEPPVPDMVSAGPGRCRRGRHGRRWNQ